MAHLSCFFGNEVGCVRMALKRSRGRCSPAAMIRKLIALPLAAALAACATVPQAPAEPVTVRIVGLNDFHGNLEPIKRPIVLEDGQGGKAEVYAGGAAWF